MAAANVVPEVVVKEILDAGMEKQVVVYEDLDTIARIRERSKGRVPVIATLDDLDEEALMRILTEPKNALVKQFQRCFDVDEMRERMRRSETDSACVIVPSVL